MIVGDARGISDGATAAAVGAVALTTPVLVMGGAPIAQEVRRAYGLVVADSSAAVGAARTAMDSAVARIRFEQQLRDQLVADLPTAAPSVTLAESARAADTVLELMVYEPSVSGREGINPGLGLCLGLRVRLIDARSGREVYYDYLDYRGPKRTLVAWAADDARPLREEVDRCIALLSREIIAQLLTRPSDEAADRATLAAFGLERRPPVPGTPGWSLPRTVQTVARN
jgi:hypothetical protein